jgi:hypothetical protein
MRFFQFTLFLSFLLPLFARTQSLIGERITGDWQGEGYGFAMDLSGDGLRIVGGAPFRNSGKGKANVYHFDGENWVKEQEKLGDEFLFELGASVAISSSGDFSIVGAPFSIYPWTGATCGKYYVMYRNDHVWGTIYVRYGSVFDWAGSGVAISGDGRTFAVGFPGGGGLGQIGEVQVYRNIDGDWSLLGEYLFGDSNGSEFGTFIELSDNGDRIAIGADWDNENGFASGQVSVYEYKDSVWQQMGEDFNGDSQSLHLGESFALSAEGSRLVIGTNQHIQPGNNKKGRVQTYDWNGTEWELSATIYGTASYDEVGRSVSLSADGERLAVGAYYTLGQSSARGTVKIFDWDGNEWHPVGENINGAAGTNFGSRVSLSSDGLVVAASAPNANGHRGYIECYELPGLLVKDTQTSIGKEISIFPNPSGDKISIAGLEKENNFTVSIYTMDGSKLLASGNNDTEIDTSHLPNGMYLAEIYIPHSGHVIVKKIIVARG